MAKQNFYSELNLRKKNINLQKIELENIKKVLEVFQDLQDAFQMLKRNKVEAMDAYDEAGLLFGKGVKARAELQEYINDANKSEENGVSVLIALDDSIAFAVDAVNNAEKVLPAFRKNADDLGLDADAVDEYREAFTLVQTIKQSEQEGTSIYKDLEDEIDNLKQISNIKL